MKSWKLFRIQQLRNAVILSGSVLTGVGAYASNDMTVASLLSITSKTQGAASMLAPTMKFVQSSGTVFRFEG